MIHIAYKYRIYPSSTQEEFLSKFFGCNRFVYNWALNKRKEWWDKNKTIDKNEREKTPSSFDISKQLTQMKKLPEYIWLSEVSSRMLGYSLRNLDSAFNNFFRQLKSQANAGYPRFKNKFNKLSFNDDGIRVDFEKKLILVPKFKEGIKTVFHREFKGTIKTSTISRNSSGKYFVSILVETESELPTPPTITKDKTVGIDLGLRSFAVVTDGEKEIKRIDHPKFLKSQKKKMARIQRKLHRKIKGSKGYQRQKVKLARLHEQIKFRRNDFLDNQTYQLTKDKSYDTIAVEKLGISEMLQTSQSTQMSYDIGDSGWLQFKSKLKYKSEREGKNFIECGRYDPTSKTCPNCNTVNKKLKSEIDWICPNCNFHVMDRDINGANNIKSFALQQCNVI